MSLVGNIGESGGLDRECLTYVSGLPPSIEASGIHLQKSPQE